MTVARRFIAGSDSTSGPRPGGTPEYRRSCPSRGSGLAKLNRFSREISIVRPEREQIIGTSTGDGSPAYFLVFPPGHTATATALNAEMCNRDRCKFSLSSRHSRLT
jgi:hypothetical protein